MTRAEIIAKRARRVGRSERVARQTAKFGYVLRAGTRAPLATAQPSAVSAPTAQAGEVVPGLDNRLAAFLVGAAAAVILAQLR